MGARVIGAEGVGAGVVGAVVVAERIAVLDAEIGRLTRLRDALKAHRGQGCAGP
ncbi:hypothetical protein [Streptomyces sp. NPDC046942]|uniref:hypothetical protein n=1 Tax=Streptomyces sp. NPDC046942 TaxID=3155137 RepID=UPI00340E8D04